MAFAFITEYAELAKDSKGNTVPVPLEPAVATQRVTFTSSTQSAAFNKKTNFVLIDFQDVAHLVIESDPTSTASSPRKSAGSAQFFGVRAEHKASFYDGTT